MNRLVIPTLAIGFALFFRGLRLWPRTRGKIGKTVLLALAAALALPGLLFVVYYMHFFFDNAAWFYEARALRFSELAAGGAGLFAGVLAAVLLDSKLITRPFLLVLLALGIVGPHLKPFLAPMPASRFQDNWSDGVCRQSTSSSCGAASAATLLQASGIKITEAEIARLCFTYAGGTENWCLARFLRSRGFSVRFIANRNPAYPIPVPSIAGVRLGGIGHFIPVIAETATAYVTGDPLVGREKVPKEQLRQRFDFTGFFMEIHKTGEGRPASGKEAIP